MPSRVKKRRRIQKQDGTDAGWEQYFDYIFPEDEATKPNLKLFAMAKAWKMANESAQQTRKRKYTEAMLHWLTLYYHQCPFPHSPTITMIRVNHLVVNLKIRISYYWNRKYINKIVSVILHISLSVL